MDYVAGSVLENINAYIVTRAMRWGSIPVTAWFEDRSFYKDFISLQIITSPVSCLTSLGDREGGEVPSAVLSHLLIMPIHHCTWKKQTYLSFMSMGLVSIGEMLEIVCVI